MWKDVKVNYDLRPIWDAILDVWKESYAICNRHNLRVWVTAGTALGAMRHKGFIPWDDDFDAMMPRKDYNLFMKYAAEELPSYMKWHSIENDPEHQHLFGKVQDERLDLLNEIRKRSHVNLEQGVFVDFFPLDGFPSTKLGCLFWQVRRSAIRRFKLFGGSGVRLQNWLMKKDFDKCQNVGWTLTNLRWPRFIYDKKWFDETLLVDFEDIKVPVPIGVDPLLKTIYGNYMKLPPEEARKPSHQIIQSGA